MSRFLGKLRSFWSEDQALTVLLISLVILAFVIGPLGLVGRLGEIVLALAVSALLITGVLTVAQKPRAAFFAALLALASLVADWLAVWRPNRTTHMIHGCLLVVFMAILIAVVLARVFRGGKVTVHRIVGAVAAYLLLGFIWSQLYGLIALLDANAFAHGSSTFMSRQEFIYFSFVTMTTVGYGDITPVHPLARSLATMEALIGQLYPAILIARLVSLEITTTSDPRRER